MDITSVFQAPQSIMHKQYEALRAFFVENKSAQEVANQFGYTKTTIYSLVRDLKIRLQTSGSVEYFFNQPARGRPVAQDHDELRSLVILLRKKYLSVPDIKSILDAQNKTVSERHIYDILRAEGFARLPRRSQKERLGALPQGTLEAPKTQKLNTSVEEFSSLNAGLLLFLPYLKTYGLDRLIESSAYPKTQTVPRLQSILAFLGLKLANVRRYIADDLWCMDRGLGLFAGLNVLPKTSWYTSYSSRVTHKMNLDFLRALHQLWIKHGLLSNTVNLDFVAVPYWGEEDHLENNWSGTRHQALCSLLAAIAQDPDSGMITYGDATVRHNNESDVVVEFLDFYKKGVQQDLKYLVFDSKFTTYENLSKLDDNGVKFITIRRRGKKIVDEIEELTSSEWKHIRVLTTNGKTRQIRVNDRVIRLKSYGKQIRQIAITGHGKIKPALIITNDFEMQAADIVRKYARRWLVEKTISEQTHFFHLNRLSSSMVIKVDFDLTMTILAHNLYRLLAKDLPGFEHNSAQTLFEKFIHDEGSVVCDKTKVVVRLKKKRRLPVLLEALEQYLPIKLPWLGNRSLGIEGASST